LGNKILLPNDGKRDWNEQIYINLHVGGGVHEQHWCADGYNFYIHIYLLFMFIQKGNKTFLCLWNFGLFRLFMKINGR
jgi:hypothetical protein